MTRSAQELLNPANRPRSASLFTQLRTIRSGIEALTPQVRALDHKQPATILSLLQAGAQRARDGVDGSRVLRTPQFHRQPGTAVSTYIIPGSCRLPLINRLGYRAPSAVA